MWLLLLVVLPEVLGLTGPLLSEETLSRRKLNRFVKDDPENSMCWERHGVDGWMSIIDTHNHFRPFYGPSVPFFTYLDWMINHGIMFSTIFGIGQKLVKANPTDPECCYYLHCPNLNYTVVPNPENDRLNALEYTQHYQGNTTLEEKIHLTLSMTFPNLQQPQRIVNNFNNLENSFPEAFTWAGEINVFKHALASNGFFEQERVTVSRIEKGEYDGLFGVLSDKKWPTTLHCDLGCDNYDKVPVNEDPRNRLSGCHVPIEEVRLASIQHQWWKQTLGPFYHSFFDKMNNPRATFSKVQHLKVWDSILTTYPDMIVVWAHLGGLSKELRDLHPHIHTHILRVMFQKYPNLHIDLSWDVLAKQNLMNHKPGASIEDLSHENHVDFNEDTEFLFNSSDVEVLRKELHETWEIHEDLVQMSGSITGPSYSMVLYLELFHEFSDRFVTGTDFVASFGDKDDYPGLKNGNGCIKDIPNHARQLTDTSSLNMFLDDEVFKKIVLGENFFRLIGQTDTFAAPPVCGDSMLPLEVIIGVSVAVGVLIILVAVLLLVLYCAKKKDGGGVNFTRVVGDNSNATTNV
jgi:hypothetical protein